MKNDRKKRKEMQWIKMNFTFHGLLLIVFDILISSHALHARSLTVS